MKDTQILIQPWRSILAHPHKAAAELSPPVTDTDEFKKGEVIIIGGQGATPPPKTMIIYDTGKE